MNILITGGAGGIGSTLAIELIKNHHITMVDDMSHGYPQNLQEGGWKVYDMFYKLDIRDTNTLKFILDRQKIDVVIHLAAITSLPECESNPQECFSVNVGGTTSVLEAVRKCGGCRVIVASSSAIYEHNNNRPYIEDILVKPRLFYPLSKKMMEDVVQSYISNYDMDIVTLRFFNVFGPRQDIHRPSPPLINYIVKCVAENKPIVLHSDGYQQRDYVHVDDVVSMIRLCLEHPKAARKTFNVCTGTLTSVRDIVEYAATAFGSLPPCSFVPAQRFWKNYPAMHEGLGLLEDVIAHEVRKLAIGSYDEAFGALGWTPNTDIPSLMVDTMKTNMNRYHGYSYLH